MTGIESQVPYDKLVRDEVSLTPISATSNDRPTLQPLPDGYIQAHMAEVKAWQKEHGIGQNQD